MKKTTRYVVAGVLMVLCFAAIAPQVLAYTVDEVYNVVRIIAARTWDMTHNANYGLPAIAEALKEKPTFFEVIEEGYTLYPQAVNDPTQYYVIEISSTRHFQVKSVYFGFYDPNYQVNLWFYWVQVSSQSGWSLDYEFTDYNPGYGSESNGGVELLSKMCLKMYPAVSGGDDFLIWFAVEAGSVVDGNENIFLEVVVESPQDAEVTVVLW